MAWWEGKKRKTDLSCDNSCFYDLEQTKIEKLRNAMHKKLRNNQVISTCKYSGDLKTPCFKIG